ncbi:uncharacterized protein J3R85_018633 [Psidium guajava]|nr:uncharacterized protein J3R85_018633 [Psidium guajava]
MGLSCDPYSFTKCWTGRLSDQLSLLAQRVINFFTLEHLTNGISFELQIFNEFNARKPDELNVFKGITRNRLFMGIVGLTLILQVIIVEFLGTFTSTVKLNWKQWLISIIIALIRLTDIDFNDLYGEKVHCFPPLSILSVAGCTSCFVQNSCRSFW